MSENGWEQRMAERAAARRPTPPPPQPIHLHGTLTACPCGAETGMTCVAFSEDYQTPATCEICGKPSEQWGDTMPFRSDVEHEVGCREHPDTTRCVTCGEPMIDGALWSGDGGPWHFREGCAPGVRTIRL